MLRSFTTAGRLRRRTYFWNLLLLYGVAFVFYGLPALAEIQFGNTEPRWRYLASAGLALCYYLFVVRAVKRLHNLNLRGWWLLLGLLPFVSLALGSGLQFVSGTAGPNRFGPALRQQPMPANVPT